MTIFRVASHRRLVADPRRGRLFLQLAYLADAEAEAPFHREDGSPVMWRDMPEETRGEIRWLQAHGNALAAEAARLGVRGGKDEAFRDVFAAAREMSRESDAREALVLRVADALERGAILTAGDVEVAHIGSTRDGKRLFAAFRDGETLNEAKLTAKAAAASFCGAQGAGEEAARAALEAWERKQEEEAAA